MLVQLLLALGILATAQSFESLKSVKNIPGVRAVNVKVTGKVTSLKALAPLIGVTAPFSLQKVNWRPIPDNGIKFRLALLYNNVIVRGFSLQATRDSYGNFSGFVTGYLPTINNLDVSVSRTNNELRKALTDLVNNNRRNDAELIVQNDIQDFASEKVVYINPTSGAASIAYYCSGIVTIPENNKNPRALFAAQDLTVLGKAFRCRFNSGESSEERSKGNSNTCPKVIGGNDKFGNVYYGSGRNEICLPVKREGNKCVLSTDKFVVKTMNNGYDVTKAKVVSFDCNKGPEDSINGARSPSMDTFNAAIFAFSMLDDLNYHVSAEPGDIEAPVIFYSHFGVEFANSFFDGRNIFLGDGNDILFPAPSSFDVVGHEIGHAISAALQTLQFGKESLAIDESFADMTGRSLIAYMGLAKTREWQFAGNLVKQKDASIRDFSDPEKDQSGIRSANDLHKISSPYAASGIFNHAYYLAIEEGKLDHPHVYQTFYHANCIYWHEDTGFIDAALGVVRAADDLQLDRDIFIDAFNKVGIDVNPYL